MGVKDYIKDNKCLLEGAFGTPSCSEEFVSQKVERQHHRSCGAIALSLGVSVTLFLI